MTQTQRKGIGEVVLAAAWNGPTAGYRAVLVADETCEWTGEVVRTEIGPRGPWSDAMLVARSRGIEWARQRGYRVSRDI